MARVPNGGEVSAGHTPHPGGRPDARSQLVAGSFLEVSSSLLPLLLRPGAAVVELADGVAMTKLVVAGDRGDTVTTRVGSDRSCNPYPASGITFTKHTAAARLSWVPRVREPAPVRTQAAVSEPGAGGPTEQLWTYF